MYSEKKATEGEMKLMKSAEKNWKKLKSYSTDQTQ